MFCLVLSLCQLIRAVDTTHWLFVLLKTTWCLYNQNSDAKCEQHSLGKWSTELIAKRERVVQNDTDGKNFKAEWVFLFLFFPLPFREVWGQNVFGKQSVSGGWAGKWVKHADFASNQEIWKSATVGNNWRSLIRGLTHSGLNLDKKLRHQCRGRIERWL